MKGRFNILFLSSWYPNKTSPQSGNFVQQHARSLKNYCNIYVLHIVPRVQKESLIIEEHINDEIKETVVYYKKVRSRLPICNTIKKILIRKKAHQLGFEKILKQASTIDLVHLNICFPAGSFALYLKRTFGIPYIITEHWTAFLESDPTKFNFLYKSLIHKILRESEMICPVSKDLKNALMKIEGSVPYKVIPNVVDLNTFKFQPKSEGKKVILHVSNLRDEHKNIKGMLRVIRTLCNKRADFEFRVVGNGETEWIDSYLHKLEIPKKFVSVRGERTYKEVAELMQESDVFLLFSNYENLPCVIAESHVMGLPVIASNVGGIKEMIDDENGVLVESKNEEDLLEKLNLLLNELPKYDRKEISENAAKKYSYQEVGKQYYNIYQNIIS